MTSYRKAFPVAAGLLSLDPLKRIRSLEELLSFALSKLSSESRDAHLEVAPGLGPQHMPNAKLYPDRETMLHALPKGGQVAEVGTWRGDFSKRIAAICRPEKFHLIDIDFAPLDERGIIERMTGNLSKHEGDSSTILRSFPASSFDWIYIDGDHSYPGARKDLLAADEVLKPAGYLMCNDYTNSDVYSAQPYGVARAVNELCLSCGYEVTGLALHGAGYHDILLRKPA